jgi:diguanylate cyclase (GGDEF)-like protein
MTLSRLLRFLAALLVLATIMLVGRIAMTEWHAYERAADSLQNVGQLRLALQAAEMVSRERGPTNGVLGDDTPAQPERIAALTQARGRTDQAFSRLQQVLPLDAPQLWRRDAAVRMIAALAALQHARAAVDHTATIARGQRTPDDIRTAVLGMVAVVPMLAPIVHTLASDAQQALPALSDDVQGARLTAELREYAGQLGSHFTAAFARQQPFSTGERAAIERTRGRIDELRFLIELRVHVPGQAPEVARGWQLVEEHYFQRASQLVAEVITAGERDGHYSMDAAGFAARYVPDMNTMFDLRDVMLDQADARAQAAQDQAQHMLITSAAGSGLLLLLLSVAMAMIHRRVLHPLAQTTQALRALADKQLDAPLPHPLADDEMAAVIAAVGTLQVQTRQREALELERDSLIERLREQSNTDFLTGLPNRRAFFTAAERDLAQARRHGIGVVLILLDVDSFKQFNDRLGHAAGDQALTEVAQTVRRAQRQGDLVARFGGEEFVLLLSHCDQDQGLRFAERLREAVANTPVATPSGEVMHLTVSLGLADSAHHGLNIETLLSLADTAMYQAKEAGRNQVKVADVPTP